MKVVVDHIIRQGRCQEICEDYADPGLSGNMRLIRKGNGLAASDGGRLVSIRTRHVNVTCIMKRRIAMNVQLLMIDLQNDFCEPNGALYVNGANEDAIRTADLIRRLGKRLDRIRMTMDCHHVIDIAHPIFWLDYEDEHPAPFTIIGVDDIEKGRFRTTNPTFMKRAGDYVRELAANDRYPLCIWPYHCLIGTWGNNIQNDVMDAVQSWERDNFAMAEIVPKGTNFWTEHYSAVKADVPDPRDPGTQLNDDLIRALEQADVIGVLGQAKSHCLANTVRDIAGEFGKENVKKLVLIEDCTSSVSGFEHLGEEFVQEMTASGMQVAQAADFLAV